MKFVLIDREFENGTPARVHRPSGTIFLPPSFFEHTEDEQKMILMHEVGHHVLQTSNESEADSFAAEQLVDELGSKRTFRALNNSLFMSPSSDERRINLFNHLKERERIMNKLDCFIDPESGYIYRNTVVGSDFDEMGQEEAFDYLNWCDYMGVAFSDMTKKEYRQKKKQAKQRKKQDLRIAEKLRLSVPQLRKNRKNKERMNISNYIDVDCYEDNDLLGFYDEESGYFYKNGIVGEDFDEMSPEEATDFVAWCEYFGVDCSDMTKKEYKAQKRQAKIDRKNAKTNKINSKADAKRTKAEAKLVKANAKQTLAEQGIDASAGAKIKDALGGVANAAKNVLGGLFGGGGAADAGADAGGYGPDGQSAIEEPKKTNWLLIGGICVAIIAVTIGLIVVLKKKKK